MTFFFNTEISSFFSRTHFVSSTISPISSDLVLSAYLWCSESVIVNCIILWLKKH